MDTATIDDADTGVIPRIPLADFQRDAAEHVTRLKQTGEPAVLVADGRPELVVQSAAAYDRLLDRVETAESLEALRASIADADAGRVQPASVVFDELYARFGLDRTK